MTENGQGKELTTGQKSCQWLITARVALHARVQLFEEYKVKNAASKRYISLAITALEKARMYMGKLMGVYGTHNPYPEGYNPENATIEPAADIYSGTLPTVHAGQEVIHIKQQRKDISVMIKGAETFRGHFPHNSEGNLFLNQVVIGLHDSTNWLGMELNALNQVAPNEDLIKEKTITEKELEDLLP